MQICSWLQRELSIKPAFPFREARSASTAAGLFDQSPIQRRTEINVPRWPPRHTHLDKHDQHLGFCLSYLNILKRRSRNPFPSDYSLFSEMDRVCLQLINLKVIRRRSGVKSKRRQWASPCRASSGAGGEGQGPGSPVSEHSLPPPSTPHKSLFPLQKRNKSLAVNSGRTAH